ncbi:MAG: LptE family protein [Myxococcota bacterium]
MALWLGVGCGYHLSQMPSPGQAPVTVDLPTFENDTFEPGIELTLAAALRREFSRAGPLRGVDDAATADYTLRGRILSVATGSRTLTPGVRAIEFTVTVRLEAVLLRNADGRRLRLDPLSQFASEVYLASFDLEISRKNRDEALRRITALLADRLYDDVDRLTSETGN